jgi:anaerobic selenocysteine-containing dehydrogenase
LHRGFSYSNSAAFLVNEALLSGETFITKPSKIVEQVALADYVQQGAFGFLYVTCMNPALTLPNQHALRAGLSREDVVVAVHDTHWTKTAQYADIVLPAPTYLGKEDLVLSWTHPYVRLSPQIVAPVTDSRSEVWVMRALAKRLGLKQAWLYEDPWNVLKKALHEAFENGDFESLRTGQLLKLKRKPADQYATSSGKIEFFSSNAEALGLSPLPMQPSLDHETGTFTLLASATANYTSTQFQEVYGPIPAVVTMHPRDAKRLGIRAGQEVNVTNAYGTVRMRVAISENVPEGVLWAPRQSEGVNGAPQNCLMSSVPQKIGHGPRFNSTRVSVVV